MSQQINSSIEIHTIKYLPDNVDSEAQAKRLKKYVGSQLTLYSEMLLNNDYCAIFWKPKKDSDNTTFYFITNSTRGEKLFRVNICSHSRITMHFEYCLDIPSEYIIDDIMLESRNRKKFLYFNASQNREDVIQALLKAIKNELGIKLLCCKELSREVENELENNYGIKLNACR